MDLEVNGINYNGSENVIHGFQEHVRNLATFNRNIRLDKAYHTMVEDDIQTIDEHNTTI